MLKSTPLDKIHTRCIQFIWKQKLNTTFHSIFTLTALSLPSSTTNSLSSFFSFRRLFAVFFFVKNKKSSYKLSGIQWVRFVCLWVKSISGYVCSNIDYLSYGHLSKTTILAAAYFIEHWGIELNWVSARAYGINLIYYSAELTPGCLVIVKRISFTIRL